LRLGRRYFELSHRKRAPPSSAREVIYGIDRLYHLANRGENIGGWNVLTFKPGYAELEKTTPHHCVLEQGLLSAAFSAARCPSIISQAQCFREGADSCVYVVSSAFTDERWFGPPEK
jgi:hypothetical protein